MKEHNADNHLDCLLRKYHEGSVNVEEFKKLLKQLINFRNAIFTAAAQTGRKVRILHQLHQPADHPINIYHPEGEYLKGLVLYVE